MADSTQFISAVIDRIQSAAATGTLLRIRGGGSKDFYGEALEGEILSTAPLSGVTSYEPSELVITALAGTPLAEVEALLHAQGQCLPFEPPHFNADSTTPPLASGGSYSSGIAEWNAATPPLASGGSYSSGTAGRKAATPPLASGGSTHSGTAGRNAATPPLASGGSTHSGTAGRSVATVGGMVAAGLSGPARASAGAVRDFVLGVKLINGKGEHLTFGGQVMKNVAGYDVSRLMAGAMGTLGLLTEISLKVLPVAPLEATLKFEMTQTEALDKLNTWGGQPLPLNASCWVQDNGVGTLYVRLRGAAAAVEAACNKLGGERLNNSQTAADWQLCRDQQLPWFKQRTDAQDLWRLSVPQTTPTLDLLGLSAPDSTLVEWHGGLRWMRAEPEHAERIRQAAYQHAGHATLFIAGSARKMAATARFDALKPPLDKIHRELKREFDPAGIFNRHRMSPDW